MPVSMPLRPTGGGLLPQEASNLGEGADDPEHDTRCQPDQNEHGCGAELTIDEPADEEPEHHTARVSQAESEQRYGVGR